MNPNATDPQNDNASQETSTPAFGQTWSVYPASIDIVTPQDQYLSPNSEASVGTGIDVTHPGDAMRAALDQAQQRAGDTVEQIKAQAGTAVEQIKAQAGTTVDQIKAQANDQLDNQLTLAGASLASVADAVDTISEQLRRGNQTLLATYADRAAGRVDEMATYLRQSDPNKVLHDLEDFARRDPALFLAGAFALGLVTTRFLKSSSSQAGNQTK